MNAQRLLTSLAGPIAIGALVAGAARAGSRATRRGAGRVAGNEARRGPGPAR